MSIARLHVCDVHPALGKEPEPAPSRSALPLPRTATLSEIFSGNGRDAGGIGFALAQVSGDKPLLWIQDRMSIGQTGRPYPPGLHFPPGLPFPPGPAFPPGLDVDLIHVEARDAKAALWAMEEGLKCAALGAVIGEIWGDPKALDFTATRRLAVAAERSGVPATLLLFGSVPNLSGARMRWTVSSRPSSPHPHDALAPGSPAWTLDLFKARGANPGRFEVSHEADGLHLLSPVRDGQLEQARRA